MRELSAPRALLASLVGVGYIYVGRLRVLITLTLGAVGLLAALAWTRLILRPEPAYIALAIGVGIGLLTLVHPVLIAIRRRQAATKPYNRWWFYVLWVIGAQFALSALVAIRGPVFGYETYRIPGVSMAPTLEAGDFIMVDTWRYRNREPSFGDVVVFRDDAGTSYVKRIVGLPGDHIEIHDGVVYRNGALLAESYLHEPLDRPYGREVAPVELTTLQFYVLGDFRDNSIDSRRYGPIGKQQLVGRVEYIALSTSGGAQGRRFPRYLHDT